MWASWSPQRVDKVGRIHSLPELEAHALPSLEQGLVGFIHCLSIRHMRHRVWNKTSAVELIIANPYTQHGCPIQKVLTFSLFSFEMELDHRITWYNGTKGHGFNVFGASANNFEF